MLGARALGGGFGGNLIAAIEAKRRPPLDRFLFALGIRHVGEVTARDLARRYRSWDNFRAMIEGALKVRGEMQPEEGEEERKFLQRRDKAVVAAVETPNIGPEVANALLDFFEEPHNREVLDDLADAGVRPEDVVWETKESPVTRQDHRLHRQPRDAVARRGQGAGREARRQGGGIGLGEDRPGRRRAGRGLQAEEGAGAGRRR